LDPADLRAFGPGKRPNLASSGASARSGIRRPTGRALPAQRKPFHAKKISPVIARNLQPNRGFLKNITGHNRYAPSVFRRVSISLCSMRDLHHGKPLNMATDFAAHNRTNVRFEKKAGTNIESLPRIFGECFCASEAYKGRDFSKLFFDPASVEYSALTRADEPTWFGNCAIGPARDPADI
jgi:hypothetical protein